MFTLTAQMIDKISFAMEDQKEQFAVEVDTGELVAVSVLGGAMPEDSYVRLPRWGSAEGFHLMESFVTSLDNPAYREQLSRALTMGKGVFRAFKDALKQSKELEKLWFTYKERRLRGVIVSWYNSNREARGLARLPAEPEETDELVASDFTLVWDPADSLDDVMLLDRDAFFEQFPDEEPQSLAARYDEKRKGMSDPGSPLSPLLVARIPAGDLAGFVWGVVREKSVHIVQAAVSPEYRGIGLGELLLRQFLSAMRARGTQRLTVELVGRSLRSSSFFQSVGFSATSQMMECGLDSLPY